LHEVNQTNVIIIIVTNLLKIGPFLQSGWRPLKFSWYYLYADLIQSNTLILT